jgi:hypothetical protein
MNRAHRRAKVKDAIALSRRKQSSCKGVEQSNIYNTSKKAAVQKVLDKYAAK